MVRRTALFGVVLCSIALAAQDKPSVPFKQIADCVRTGSCRNMASATINWFDVVGINVLTFSDDGWTYQLRVGASGNKPERLTIYLTPPGERRPTEQLSLDMNGRLVTAELGPQPGERVPSRVDYATWVSIHQAYSAADWHPSGQVSGEQFRPFWQKRAEQALAAIARVMTR